MTAAASMLSPHKKIAVTVSEHEFEPMKSYGSRRRHREIDLAFLAQTAKSGKRQVPLFGSATFLVAESTSHDTYIRRYQRLAADLR